MPIHFPNATHCSGMTAMKLSKDAEELAELKFNADCGQIVAWRQAELHKVQSQPRSGTLYKAIADLYLESLGRIKDALVQTRKEAYKSDGRTIDENDIKELVDKIKSMGWSMLSGVTESGGLNLDIVERINRITAETETELKIFMTETALEKKQKDRYRMLRKVY